MIVDILNSLIWITKSQNVYLSMYLHQLHMIIKKSYRLLNNHYILTSTAYYIQKYYVIIK